MSFQGHVEDGAVVMDEPLPLPNGTAVEVNPLSTTPPSEEPSPTLLEVLGDLVGSVKGMPEDASRQLDHYLYGTPKR